MSRMLEIEKQLSMVVEKRRHIVYFVTEDRDILESVFEGMADTMKGILQYGVDGNIGKVLQAANRDSLFRVAKTNGVLVDAYEAFRLKEKEGSYIPEGLFLGGKPSGAFDGMRTLPALAYPSVFLLNDFHIIRDSVAAHLIKQFLLSAEREEREEGRFVLLFLVSPKLKLPEGFESEIEVLDIPEMDEEDIREFLLIQAQKEYGRGGLAIGKWKEEIDPADKKRIWDGAKDFRGISKKGIEEIITDIQAEYGSFFGRAQDATGMEENLFAIKSARKRKVAELKKREARYDSTVTMKEPGGAVAGMKAFSGWLDDIKEEFLDLEKAGKFGNEPPKGVLLTGIPGSGKTQASKMAAAKLGGKEENVPLVQFRMDNLLGGLVGDSEANFKRCRKRIESLAPCIVLIDEIEKTFDSKEGSGGSKDVKMNILTALLDWMQENQKQIFFFATSNSVANLRPELLRDGRFDMRFCLFMPTFDELADIFQFHMEKAHARSGKRLFEKFDYREAAKEFLKEITAYGRKNEKYMFYTGANVVNLITQANRSLRKKMEHKKEAMPFSRKIYVKALLEAAKGPYSQPYGMTNMKDIVEFWLSAYENQYTNASHKDLFPFGAYDEERCEFREKEVPERTNSYDSYLFDSISYEVEKYQERTKGKKV